MCAANAAPGFHGDDTDLIYVTRSGRIWLVESPDEGPDVLRELSKLPGVSSTGLTSSLASLKNCTLRGFRRPAVQPGSTGRRCSDRIHCAASRLRLSGRHSIRTRADAGQSRQVFA
jgi:hypothetical protein